MLPANRLRKGTLHRLHVYAGHEHPHGHHLLPFPSV
jgi:ribosomal protein L13